MASDASPGPRPLRPTWLRGLALSALGLAVATLAWWPMIAAYPKTAEEDGRYVFHQFEIAKASILQYGELPLWNAFDCRGIPMWDHPENMTASPFVWGTAFLSTTVTMIVWNLAHVAAGFVGMWLLARHELRLSRLATFTAATMWAVGVGHTSQYAGEHETLISFFNAPLLLFLWRRAETSASARVGAGVLVAWMFYDGATYPLPYTLLVVALETVTRLTSLERAKRIALAAGAVGLVSFGLAAARLLPLVDQLASHSRRMHEDTDGIRHWSTIEHMYTLRSPHWRARFDHQQYVFGEYVAYVGWGGVLLVLLGVLVAGAEVPWLLWLSVVMVVLMMGHFGPYAPWTFLRNHVFPFKSMRVAARFRLLFHLALSAYVGLAVDWLPRRLGRVGLKRTWVDAARVVLVGTALVVVGDQMGLGQEILAYRFNGAPLQKLPRAERFSFGGPGLSPDFIDQPRQNRAYLGCRAEWVYHADAAVWTGDVPQVRAAAAEPALVVESSSRTHNTFTAVVNASAPGRVLLNTAHDKGWRSTVGTVVEHEHLLAVDVPAGRHTVFVRYWPRLLTPGFWITGLTIVGLVLWGLRRRIAAAVARLRARAA